MGKDSAKMFLLFLRAIVRKKYFPNLKTYSKIASNELMDWGEKKIHGRYGDPAGRYQRCDIPEL